ncbi:MAG: hypothetical protein P8L44_16660 [Opitutales bacterium]|nr:hypothetical protein [Opitutales bacterium]
MKRDISVLITFIGFNLIIVAQLLLNVVGDYESEPTAVNIIFAVEITILCLRTVVLWFQTFFHSVKNLDQVASMGWALAHLFAFFLAPFVYYYVSRKALRSS